MEATKVHREGAGVRYAAPTPKATQAATPTTASPAEHPPPEPVSAAASGGGPTPAKVAIYGKTGPAKPRLRGRARIVSEDTEVESVGQQGVDLPSREPVTACLMLLPAQ